MVNFMVPGASITFVSLFARYFEAVSKLHHAKKKAVTGSVVYGTK